MTFGLALVLLVSAFAAKWLWIRLKYDLHKIPVAPGAVPGLGESCRGLGNLAQGTSCPGRTLMPQKAPALRSYTQ